MTFDFGGEYPVLPSFRFDTYMDIAKERQYSMRDRVGYILSSVPDHWVCGNEFYRRATPTFSQRISEMRAAGATIVSEPCPEHGPVHRYRWVSGA